MIRGLACEGMAVQVDVREELGEVLVVVVQVAFRVDEAIYHVVVRVV